MKVYPLNLDSTTFAAFKADFEQMLSSLIKEMGKMDSEEATITAKMVVRMKHGQARDFQANGYDAMRDIIQPSFEHKISSVMQVKSEKSGSLGGNYELVWDKELNKYVMVEVDNGQQSMFDDEEADAPIETTGEVVTDVPALEAGIQNALPSVEQYDMTPYEILMDYLGDEMKVLEQNGLYTVRLCEDNRVVVSSALSENHPFFCDAEILKNHVGHRICCVTYHQQFENEMVKNVALKCMDCDECLFVLQEPDDYGYEPPEE